MNQLYIFLVLIACMITSLYLARVRQLKNLSASMIVILLTAIVANLGIIPTSTAAPPIYDAIFTYIAPMAIFYLMLSVNLKSLKKAGFPMIRNFLTGSVGVLLGVAIGAWAVNSKMNIGEQHFAIAGMFTGTYIGGSINLNAIALHYGVAKEGALYAAVSAVDNIVTVVWMVATTVIPILMKKLLPTKRQEAASDESYEQAVSDRETVDPLSISWLILLGYGSLWIAQILNKAVPNLPMVIWLTTIALILAQLPIVQKLKGNKLLGMLFVYLFLAVIGAFCDIPALMQNGQLALTLALFVVIIIVVHSLVLFGIGYLLKQDWDMLGIASQANIGGASSALVCAQSLGRHDLGLASILIGTLGNAIGTYLGIFMAEWLR